jgi:hypothetical protein
MFKDYRWLAFRFQWTRDVPYFGIFTGPDASVASGQVIATRFNLSNKCYERVSVPKNTRKLICRPLVASKSSREVALRNWIWLLAALPIFAGLFVSLLSQF